MLPAQFLDLIETSFNEEEKQVLIACLFQDQRIVDALEEISRAKFEAGLSFKALEGWKPQVLFHLIVKSREGNETLNSTSRGIDAPALDLFEAGKFAEELYSQSKKDKVEIDLSKLLIMGKFSRNGGLVAACLFDHFENVDEFIKSNDHFNNREIKKIFIYGLFCNPQSSELLERRVELLLQRSTYEGRIELIHFIKALGREETIKRFIVSERAARNDQESEDSDSLSEDLKILGNLNYFADVDIFANDVEQSIQDLELMQKRFDVIQQGISEKIKEIQNRDSEDGSLRANNSLPEAINYNWRNIPVVSYSLELEHPAIEELEEHLLKVEQQAIDLPQTAQNHDAIADHYHSLGDTTKTIEHLRIARLLDKDNAKRAKRLYEAYIESSQWDKARDLVTGDNFVGKSKQDFLDFYLKIKDLIQKDKKEAALQLLQGFGIEAIDLDHDQNLQLGELLSELQCYENARKHLQQCVVDSSNDPKPWLLLYRCNIKLGLLQEAQRLINDANTKFKDKKGYLAELAAVFIDIGNDEEALELVNKIDFDGARPEIIAKIIRFLNGQQKNDTAIKIANKSIAHYPLHPQLGLEASTTYVEVGERERARYLLPFYRTEKKDDPQYLILTVLAAIGSSLSRFPLGTALGQDVDIPMVENTINILPDGHFWKELMNAEFQRLIGNDVSSTDGYKKIILENSLGANRNEIWRAQVGLSQVMKKMGHKETAIALLNECAKNKPDNLDIYDLLVDAYRTNNLPEEALSTIKKAYSQCKKDERVIPWFVSSMLSMGKPKEVHEYFSKGNDEIRHLPVFLLERIKFEYHFGNRQLIRGLLEEMLTADPICEKDVRTAIDLSEKMELHDISLQLIDKLSKCSGGGVGVNFLEAIINWNRAEYAQALEDLAGIPDNGDLGLLLPAIQILIQKRSGKGKYHIESVLEVVENVKEIDRNVAGMDPIYRDLFPQEWNEAIGTVDYWLQILIDAVFSRDVDEKNLERILRVDRNIIVKPTTLATINILDWMIHGDKQNHDWGRLIETLLDGEQSIEAIDLEGLILHIMLLNGEEIAVARIVNELSEIMLTSPAVLWAKARILKRNGNIFEAQHTFESGVDVEEQQHSVVKELSFWKAETAFDLGIWQHAVDAYLTDRANVENFNHVSTIIQQRIMQLALKEYGYRNLGVINNLPKLIKDTRVNKVFEQQVGDSPNATNIYHALYAFVAGDENSLGTITIDAIDEITLFIKIVQAGKKQAEEELQRLLNDPHLQPDHLIFALPYMEQLDSSEFLNIWNDAIFKHKENAYLYAGVAILYMKLEQNELAINAYESALGILEEEPIWMEKLAAFYELEGNLQKAIHIRGNVITKYPDDMDLVRTQCMSLYQSEKYQEMIELFETYTDKLRGDENIWRKAANAYYQIEEYRKSLSLINEIEQGTTQDLELILLRTRIAIALKSTKKAMELIRIAYEIDPMSTDVICELAKIKSMEKDEAYGLEIIEKALNSGLRDEGLIIEKANYLLRINGEKKAIDFLSGYIEKSKEISREILNMYADLQNDAGNHKEAVDAWSASLSKEDHQAKVHESLGLLNAAQGNLDNAVFHLNKAIEMEPSRMQAYITLSDVYIQRREGKRAEKTIKKALDNCREHNLIYEQASRVYNHIGNLSIAEEYLRKAVNLNPKDEGLRERLGILLAKRIFNKQEE